MTFVKVLLALGFVSILFAGLLKALEVFRAPNRSIYIKFYILLIAVIPAVAGMIHWFSAGRVIGELLPGVGPVETVRGFVPINAFSETGDRAAGLILSLYLFTVSLFLCPLIYSYANMRRFLGAAVRGRAFGCDIFTRAGIASPFSFGFFRPRIYLPADYLHSQNISVLRMAIAHESHHVRARDPAWKTLSHVVRAALFFSPAAWWLHRRLDLEMEIDCDRRTIATSGASVNAYGHFLLDAVEVAGSHPLLTYMSDTNIKRRIEEMKTKTESRYILAAILVLAAMIGTVTAVAAATGISKFNGYYKVQAQIFVDGRLVSTPQIVSMRGEEASIEMKTLNPETELKMKLVADDWEDGHVPGAILLTTELEYKNADRKLRARPRIAVNPGEEGTITLTADEKGSFELRIKAERL